LTRKIDVAISRSPFDCSTSSRTIWLPEVVKECVSTSPVPSSNPSPSTSHFKLLIDCPDQGTESDVKVAS
jgi:hypothetical protein